MSRPLGLLGGAGFAAAVTLLPAGGLAFNTQPDPSGIMYLKQQDTSLGGPDTKSKSNRASGSTNLPAVQKGGSGSTNLPAVQKGGSVGVDPSDPNMPTWARDAFGSGGGGSGGGGGGR